MEKVHPELYKTQVLDLQRDIETYRKETPDLLRETLQGSLNIKQAREKLETALTKGTIDGKSKNS